MVLYCRLTPDYLPDPYACLVHGITPQEANRMGSLEYDFAKAIRNEMLRPGTCALGFNSVHFDDEFIRNLFYRNLFDPYEREWKQGNSRWDVLNLFRAAHDLRPEGFVWPVKDNGKPAFKLTALSGANGIPHENAHDALHDVDATIKLAWLLKQSQPKLYSWYWNHRTAESLRPHINVVGEEILLHTSAQYTSTQGCTAPVLPVSLLPGRKDSVIAVDLRQEIGALFDMNVTEMKMAYRKSAFEYNQKKKDSPGGQYELFPYFSPEFRLPLVEIKLNRCPYLAPFQILDEHSAARLGIDRGQCLERMKRLRKAPELVQKIIAVFSPARNEAGTDDPDYTIYTGGFFGNDDRRKLAGFHESLASLPPAESFSGIKNSSWDDSRIKTLLFRLAARNWPELLTDEEAGIWKSFCANRLLCPPSEGALDYARFKRLVRGIAGTASSEEKALLRAFLSYGKELEKACLTLDPDNTQI